MRKVHSIFNNFDRILAVTSSLIIFVDALKENTNDWTDRIIFNKMCNESSLQFNHFGSFSSHHTDDHSTDSWNTFDLKLLKIN